MPKNVPKVTWTVTEKVTREVAGIAVTGKRLIGRVDNSGYPAISVGIEMALVTPANAKGPVPVLMMFGFGGLPGDPPPARPGGACGGR